MQKDSVIWSPAGFWVRCGAYVIDSFLISLAMSPLVELNNSSNQGHLFRMFGVQLLIWGLYGAICNIWLQGSIGKKILGLKIVDRYEGRAVSFPIVFFRDSIGRFISLLPLGGGFLWAAFNKEKKTLHDHIFATRVVKKVPVAVYGQDESRKISETP